MQKIRLELSHLSPQSIDCLSTALLSLSRNLPEPVLFEFTSESSNRLKDRILLPVSKGDYCPACSIPLFLSSVIAVTCDRHYLNIICKDQTFRTRMRLQDFQELLPGKHFFSPCRGVLLNLSHAKAIHGQDIQMSDDSTYPIARSRRHELLLQFRSNYKHSAD